MTSPQKDLSLDSTLLGEITWMMMHSELHKDWPISSIMQWAVPPLLNKQCRVYRQGARPVGYVSWASLSEEAETKFASDPTSLQPVDWTSGKRLWFVDWIAPWGGTWAMTKDLKNNVFPNDVARFMRWKADSDTLNIFYLHGANAVAQARDHEENPAVKFE